MTTAKTPEIETFECLSAETFAEFRDRVAMSIFSRSLEVPRFVFVLASLSDGGSSALAWCEAAADAFELAAELERSALAIRAAAGRACTKPAGASLLH
jgi:hypothetical protein